MVDRDLKTKPGAGSLGQVQHRNTLRELLMETLLRQEIPGQLRICTGLKPFLLGNAGHLYTRKDRNSQR